MKCVPNTELPLLNIRSPNTSLVKTFSVRLESDEWGRGNQSRDGPPQSPLFAFSSVISEDGDNSSTRVECTSKKSYSLDLESSPESQTSSGDDDERFHHHNARSFKQLSFLPPSFSSALCVNATKCNEWDYLQRKRSATVAHLSDSESESEKEKTGQSSTAMESTAKASLANSIPGSDISCEPKDDGKVKYRSESSRPTIPSRWRPCLIPKRVTLAKETGSKQSLLERPSKGIATTSDGATGLSPCASVQNNVNDNLVIPLAAATISSKAALTPRTIDALQRKEASPAGPSDFGQYEVVEGELACLKSRNESLPTPTDASIAERTVESSESTTASPEPSAGIKCCRSGLLACECKNCPVLEQDPELILQNGILFIKNPRDARPATYKFSITVSVVLVKNRSTGWFNLFLPGLPKLGDDDCGYFLFQVPEKRGLEFRTTNLQRYKMVENCFFAEFANSANFVVPLRVCNKRFYGVIRDFTVDQEIRAEHNIRDATSTSGHGDSQTNLSVKYNALCSLRLHNRCFSSEKCCFFLYVDGGPDGFYQCQIDPQSAGLQIIRLNNEEERPIGLSHVRIICSPKHLEMFCLSWEIHVPGKKAMNWLPRIYPASASSCHGLRHYLRSTFTELEARSLDEELYYNNKVRNHEEGQAEPSSEFDEDGAEEDSDYSHYSESDEFNPFAHFLDFRLDECEPSLVLQVISRIIMALCRPSSVFTEWRVYYVGGLTPSKRRTLLSACCIGFLVLLTIFSIRFYPVSADLFGYSQYPNNTAPLITLNGYPSLERYNISLLKNEPRDLLRGFAKNMLRIAKSDTQNHDALTPAELNVDMPRTLNDDENGNVEGLEDVTHSGEKNTVKFRVEIEEIPEEDTPTVQTQESPAASPKESMKSPGPSLRDRIDYLLGWSGPVFDMAEDD